MARFMLMNKDHAVLSFEYDMDTHVATRITEVVNAAFAPLGLFDERGNVSKRELNYWWRHRAIPVLREDEELVSAYDLIRLRKQSNNESDLKFYVRCCEELGIHNVMDGLARMFACDYVLANRDRHWRNFGVMRNVETLRGTRLAPIFDTGSCLWSDVPQLELPIDFKYTAKPFKYNGMRPYEQLRLFVGHLEWVDPQALADFPDYVGDVLATNPNIGQRRIDAIVRHVRMLADDLAFVASK